MSQQQQDVSVLFDEAAERMRTNTSLQLSNEQRLELYGYYKQATEGQCKSSKPGFFDFTGRAKWEAWRKHGQMPSDEAKKLYVELVNEIDPNWRSTPIAAAATKSASTSSSGGATGPAVSRMIDIVEDNPIPDDQKTLVDWSSEGAVQKVTECLAKGEDINMTDDEGMTSLHWACDRGHFDVVKTLIERGANILAKDTDGQTPLHYATSCGHREVALLLINGGADTTALDNHSLSPRDICEPSIKDIFNNISLN